MAHQVQLYRIRVVLKIHRHVRLHALHAPVVHALLCHANGRGFDIEPAIPDGLFPEAVEQCRTELRKDDPYAFGFTLLTGSTQEAHSRISALIRGLNSVGESAAHNVRLGGNFHVDRVTDLQSRTVISADVSDVAPLPSTRLTSEIAALQNCRELTLVFQSPLRMERPRQARSRGHAYMDSEWLDGTVLTRRIQNRQRRIGFLAPGDDTDIPDECLSVVSNHLTWLDVTYGHAQTAKTLGGCTGRLRLKIDNPAVLSVLVTGQYTGAGNNTGFGFGRYRIEELGPDATACDRSISLTELAFRYPAADNVAVRYHLESGRLSEQIREIHAGRYVPSDYHHVWIDQGPKRRQLSIPSRLDRGLQRCVNDLLAPAIDRFLESSSFAYRKGLNRESAARRLKTAWTDGYRWALRTDFLKFFDSVDHRMLKDRLDACVNDRGLTDLIMKWVVAGAPEAGRGLPTGAVLSPLLANLFLDTFDQQVASDGRCLIRYADDLMLLFRSEQDAQNVFNEAEDAAAALALELNSEKTKLVDLRHPFTFLGFRFEPERHWQPLPVGQPVRIDELGWSDSDPADTLDVLTDIRLPGEKLTCMPSEKSVVILGPGIQKLDVRQRRLCYQYSSSSQQVQARAMDRIRQIVVLGIPTLSYRFVKSVSRNRILVSVIDEGGRSRVMISADAGRTLPGVVRRQCSASDDPGRRLLICRQLIRAKLQNYAILAERTDPSPMDNALPAALWKLRRRIDHVSTLEELLGIEGAAAAEWYREFESRLGGKFRFEKRISPRASDPVNVMLNIAQTVLYRQCTVLLHQEGFVSSIGFLHKDRSGHQTLASDIQEPFRHLMERAVIEATHQLHRSDFEKTPHGPFRLTIKPHAVKRLMTIVHRLLTLPVRAEEKNGEAVEYRVQILRTIRSLKRHLTSDTEPFLPFCHVEE